MSVYENRLKGAGRNEASTIAHHPHNYMKNLLGLLKILVVIIGIGILINLAVKACEASSEKYLMTVKVIYCDGRSPKIITKTVDLGHRPSIDTYEQAAPILWFGWDREINVCEFEILDESVVNQ